MTNRSIISRLRRGSLEAFVLHSVGAGTLFLMHVVLGRTMDAAGYGVFSYALTVAGVLAVVVPLGWPTALIRFIAQYREQQNWGLLRGAVQRAFQITLVSSILAALVLCAVSYLPAVPPRLATSLRFAALILPLLSFVGLRRKALQGLQRVKASIVPEEIVFPLLVVSGVYLFAATTVTSALLIYTGAAFCVLLLGSLLLWRSLPTRGRTVKPEFETRRWMIVALPMVFGGLGQIVMNRTDMLMLGAMTDMQAVGLYGAATRIALLNTLVLGAVNTLAAPMMSAAYHGGRPREAGYIMSTAILWSTVGALPMLTGMLLFPATLLGVFGAEFASAGLLLQILAIGQFVNAATGPAGFALLMTQREWAFAWTLGAAAVVNVVGNLLTIPAYGAVGAAAVTAGSVTILNLSQLLLTLKPLFRSVSTEGRPD